MVQAGGGNTSLKENGTLWVKASGKWLADALVDEMFLAVPIADVLAKLAAREERFDEYATASGVRLRPSVETTVHAVFPQRMVVHVHSVRAISWAVQSGAEASLQSRLDGLRWAWIPYVHPGVPLAEYIDRELQPKPDVLIIRNHGLVVAAQDCTAAETLLRDVEARLNVEPSFAPGPDLSYLRQLSGAGPWAPAENAEVHALGTNPRFSNVAAGGTMYPDHCVYLGPGAPILRDGDPIANAIERYRARNSYEPSYLLVEGKGVLTNKLSRAGQQLLICLKRIVERIPESAHVNYLDDREVAALMNWDAEKYRLSMASPRP